MGGKINNACNSPLTTKNYCAYQFLNQVVHTNDMHVCMFFFFFSISRLHVLFIKKSRKKRQVTDTMSSQVIQGLPMKPKTQTKARNMRGPPPNNPNS